MTWPAVAKIVEARLRIVAPSYGARSAMHRKGTFGPQLAERWECEIALAPMSRAQARVYEAWLASLRGRLNAFLMPAAAGFLTHSATAAGTITTQPVAGDDELAVTFSAAGPALAAGTLIAIGAPTAAAYQVVELLAAVTPNGAEQVISIAPRRRHAYLTTTPKPTANVQFRFHLADDANGAPSFNVQTGTAGLAVVEAIATPVA